MPRSRSPAWPKTGSGLTGPITSVRQAARSMGLTRARVYQLLNEINDILAVRWPHGRHQMYELREKLMSESKEMDSPPDLQQFLAAVELFYPGSRRGAAGPLEYVLGEEEADEEVEATADEEELVERGRSLLPEVAFCWSSAFRRPANAKPAKAGTPRSRRRPHSLAMRLAGD